MIVKKGDMLTVRIEHQYFVKSVRLEGDTAWYTLERNKEQPNRRADKEMFVPGDYLKREIANGRIVQ